MKIEPNKKRYISISLLYNAINSNLFLYPSLLLWLFLVTVFSIIPAPERTILEDSDKIFYLLIYLVTTYLFYLSFRKKKREILFWSCLFSFSFGLFMEIIQILPYRDFSLGDILANTGVFWDLL